MKKCIVLGNGRLPSKGVVSFLIKNNYSKLICADGGANSAKKLGLKPDNIIGDLDSINETTLNFYKNISKVFKISRQNDTDIEKCLKFIIKNKFTEVVLLGVTGDRLDHTFCNLGIVLKYFKKIKIKLIAENSILIPYKGNVKFSTAKGETISLYGFDNKTKITSKNLKYPLKNTSLPFGKKESTSNMAVSSDVELKINGGKIFVIRDFNIVKSHDFF